MGVTLRRAVTDVLGAVWAGAVHSLHGHLVWLSKQLFWNTAEHAFVKRMASLYGLSPTPATFASGTTLATGSTGATISTGETLSSSTGVVYEVTADATISSGSASVSVQAVDAGAAGELEAGETLTFDSAISGVDAATTVESGGIAGGNDEESPEDFAARFALHIQKPPQGGADQDWEAWALSVAGVTRAWVYENENGLGTVVVRFVVDDDETSIIPDAADVTAVQAKLDEESPVCHEPTAAAPTESAVAFTISITPDTTAIRDAVEAELEDLLFRDAEPGDGAGRGKILLSQMQTAIGSASGVEDFSLTVPAADVTPATGALPVLGTITWV